MELLKMNHDNTPKIFIYNPTCEIAIANGTVSYMPNKTLSLFEKDLDVIPMYFGNENDIVLVQQLPDDEFIQTLKNANIAVPHFKILKEVINQKQFIDLPKHSLQPWGWSPRIHHIFKDIKASCRAEFREQPNAYWHEKSKELYSRKQALEILESLLEKEENPLYIHKEKIAKVCTQIDEIEKLIEKWKQIVIKAPWSSSGRGLQVMRQSCLNQSIIQWINGTIQSQGYVMVEALLNKKLDFSLQFFIDSNGDIKYLGNAYFQTNSNGQYSSNVLGETPEIIKESLPPNTMSKLINDISGELKKSGLTQKYNGFMGVDCLIYEDNNGENKIQPCLEINLRYNMGILSMLLEKNLHPETKGIFKIYYQPRKSFDQFHKEMNQKYPFAQKEGKWYKGYLPLVSYSQNKQFGAYVLLEKK